MSNIQPGSFYQLSSSQSSGDDKSSIWGGLISFGISACVFFFYAYEQFGVLWGILYSLFWYFTIPVHYLLSCI